MRALYKNNHGNIWLCIAHGFRAIVLLYNVLNNVGSKCRNPYFMRVYGAYGVRDCLEIDPIYCESTGSGKVRQQWLFDGLDPYQLERDVVLLRN